MLGKYFLDEIDGVAYSTDSYEIHTLYDAMFFVSEPEPEHKGIVNPFECHAPANRNSWLKGLAQEKKRYDRGFRYKYGRWVKEVKT